MPIYTYQCDNCGVRFERQQSFSDKPLNKCPECNHKALRKVYTPAGVIFKGSGWYVTDSRSPKKTTTTKSDGDHKKVEPKKEKASTGSSGTSA